MVLLGQEDRFFMTPAEVTDIESATAKAVSNYGVNSGSPKNRTASFSTAIGSERES